MLRYYKYQTPFKKPFKTALGTFSHREGIILTYTDGTTRACGEAAPLPGFSLETLTEVEAALKTYKSLIEDGIKKENFSSLIAELEEKCPFPSLLFGVDTLIHDLKANRLNIPIQELLFGKSENQVHCNTTIGMQSVRDSIQQAELKIRQGFSTIKVKVGSNFENEKRILSSLRRAFPEIKLRIDANQAWGKKEAVHYLNQLAEFNIEYCEQPIAADDVTGLKWIKENSKVPLAADEGMINKKLSYKIIENKCSNFVIIKPVLRGSFQEINVTKQHAKSHGMAVVFTTALDGIIGRTVTAILALGLGSKRYAHGLETGSFLKEQYSGLEQIKEGYYIFSEQPGFSQLVDLSLLKEVY